MCVCGVRANAVRGHTMGNVNVGRHSNGMTWEYQGRKKCVRKQAPRLPRRAGQSKQRAAWRLVLEKAAFPPLFPAVLN